VMGLEVVVLCKMESLSLDSEPLKEPRGPQERSEDFCTDGNEGGRSFGLDATWAVVDDLCGHGHGTDGDGVQVQHDQSKSAVS